MSPPLLSPSRWRPTPAQATNPATGPPIPDYLTGWLMEIRPDSRIALRLLRTTPRLPDWRTAWRYITPTRKLQLNPAKHPRPITLLSRILRSYRRRQVGINGTADIAV